MHSIREVALIVTAGLALGACSNSPPPAVADGALTDTQVLTDGEEALDIFAPGGDAPAADGAAADGPAADGPAADKGPAKTDGPIACGHDCDCAKLGMVCQNNTCQRLKRMSACRACGGGFCKAGEPCLEKSGAIGTCPKPGTCKHDCDCRKVKMVCASSGGKAGTCQPLRRLSNCLACSSARCKKGDPCYKPGGSFGICR